MGSGFSEWHLQIDKNSKYSISNFDKCFISPVGSEDYLTRALRLHTKCYVYIQSAK